MSDIDDTKAIAEGTSMSEPILIETDGQLLENLKNFPCPTPEQIAIAFYLWERNPLYIEKVD